MSDFDWISREFRWQTERIDDHFRTLTAKIDSLHKELARNSHDVATSVQTNADRIRSMTDEELAEHNVREDTEYVVDYDWDENPIGEYMPCFKTSDGAIFWSYEDAVVYELQWLKRPYEEEP